MSPWLPVAAATFATLAALGRDPAAHLQFADDLEAPIIASVYSLPPALVEETEARRFLGALRALHPDRDMIVWSEAPLLAALTREAGPRVQVLAGGGAYSLWPRDPFLFARRPDGGVVVVTRPNVQRGRAADGGMGAALARDLAPRLAVAWGGVSSATAPFPFHGGNLLQTQAAAWTTLHGLEIAILDHLGLTAVPVESFASAEGRERYQRAATEVATKLGEWLGRPVQFVHPTTTTVETMRAIGGGAGFDLDSLLTFVPALGNYASPTALVGDIGAGRRLIQQISDDELGAFRTQFELGPVATRLRETVLTYARSSRAADLDAYLNLCAEHLASVGHRVERLPLVLVPSGALADQEGVEAEDFVVTWNNVVVEGNRAVGFSSGLETGDRAATQIFAGAGVALDLVPALRRSVVLGGGYRCASNHLRAIESAR